MFRISILTIIATLFICVMVHASDFTPADFDPADPSQAGCYRQAVNDLMDTLAATGIDEDGDELFKVIPFPIELVALQTQYEIHEGNVSGDDELSDLISEANMNKPAANSYAFVVDGKEDWVNGGLAVYFYPDLETEEPIEVVTYPVTDADAYSDGYASRSWAVLIEDAETLNAFLESPKVIMLVYTSEEGTEPIELDISFWRQWGLFDLRTGEE
jgi:hypothetical protein